MHWSCLSWRQGALAMPAHVQCVVKHTLCNIHNCVKPGDQVQHAEKRQHCCWPHHGEGPHHSEGSHRSEGAALLPGHTTVKGQCCCRPHHSKQLTFHILMKLRWGMQHTAAASQLLITIKASPDVSVSHLNYVRHSMMPSIKTLGGMEWNKVVKNGMR